MLESVESAIENDEAFKTIRHKVQEAVEKCPKSVTLEAALEQVKNSK